MPKSFGVQPLIESVLASNTEISGMDKVGQEPAQEKAVVLPLKLHLILKTIKYKYTDFT